MRMFRTNKKETLKIEGLTESDAGTYTCETVIKETSEKSSDSIELKIEGSK